MRVVHKVLTRVVVLRDMSVFLCIEKHSRIFNASGCHHYDAGIHSMQTPVILSLNKTERICLTP